MPKFFKKSNFSRTKYFDNVYKQNLFHGQESLSGEGSSLEATRVLRREIPSLLNRFNITSILDVPCGDLNWMKEILPLTADYTGADVSMDMVRSNKKKFREYKFIQFDAVKEVPDSFDLILCRDLLVHLPLEEATQVIQNFLKSDSKYLLTTTFLNRELNEDFKYSPTVVQWRPLNLSIHPFMFPKPVTTIVEECMEGDGNFADKVLGLYDLDSLRSRI
jgi:SAM-dependent methyltransferase